MEVRNFFNGRKGVFFSADALIALTIILVVLLVAYPLNNYIQPDSDVHSDVLRSLSVLKVEEVNLNTGSAYYSLLEDEKTLLEQMSELYVLNPGTSYARDFVAEILDDLNTTENIGIWFGNDTLIYSQNSTPYETAREVDVVRQTISGILEGRNTTGFAARAFLSPDSRTEYFYFGGYVGDGNISAQIEYDGNITGNATLEAVVNNDFEIWVNNLKVGDYEGSLSAYNSVVRPIRYEFSTSDFHDGVNTLELRGDNLYIAGGFVKINYRGEAGAGINRYNFPGITGLINLYDGFYIPGNLTSMDILLNYSSDYTTFLSIGNTTVHNSSVPGPQSVHLDNSYLSGLIDYDSLEGGTVPIRLGLENVSATGISKSIDVFSVTDVSGSMASQCAGVNGWCCLLHGFTCYTSQSTCETCSGDWSSRINAAKSANNAFIDYILNTTSNRVGLVAYREFVPPLYTHELSNNSASLKSKVSQWNADGGTCICCGVINATQKLNLTSSSSNFRSIVVMSDGAANVQCASQGTVPDMDGVGGSNTSADHAIFAARQACAQGIVIHSVGFEVDGLGRDTLQRMVQVTPCNGSYHDAGAENLSEIYRQVADTILAEYQEQTLVSSEGDIFTALYPSSRIDFEFSASESPKGLLITLEKMFNSSGQGQFSIPSDASPIITRVVSYSGPKWTSKVLLNNNTLFDLNTYQVPYTKLGDPYQVTTTDSIIAPNSTNSVNVFVGSSAGENVSGSQYNRIIYTVLKNSTAYSGRRLMAGGCEWTVQFQDNSYADFFVPAGYTGDSCAYTNQTIHSYGNGQIDYDDDAYQVAVRDLFRELDLDDDGRVDVLLSGSDLDINVSEITGLPFDWSTEIEVRRWIQ